MLDSECFPQLAGSRRERSERPRPQTLPFSPDAPSRPFGRGKTAEMLRPSGSRSESYAGPDAALYTRLRTESNSFIAPFSMQELHGQITRLSSTQLFPKRKLE